MNKNSSFGAYNIEPKEPNLTQLKFEKAGRVCNFQISKLENNLRNFVPNP